jgi:hypothetical protein
MERQRVDVVFLKVGGVEVDGAFGADGNFHLEVPLLVNKNILPSYCY